MVSSGCRSEVVGAQRRAGRVQSLSVSLLPLRREGPLRSMR